MKRLALVLSVVLLTGFGCAPSTPSDDGRVVEPSTAVSDDSDNIRERTVIGTVSSVSLDGVAADGPAIIQLTTSAGASIEVDVPSFGLGLCAAKANIADVFAIKEGDAVEVRGAVTEEGAIVPCESSDHYLRVTAK